MEYIEIAKFKLKADCSDEHFDAQFIEAERLVRAGIIKETPGYLGRELYKSDRNEWVIILRYDSKRNMDALLASLKENLHSSFQAYAAAIDFSTMRMEFFTKQL